LTEDESAVLDLDEHRKARGQTGKGPAMVPTEAAPQAMAPDATPPAT